MSARQINPTERSADLSECGRYRYALWRTWAPGGHAMFVGLNPSTADETLDDPTIRRCARFARDFGCGGLCMTNLFAFRATRPHDMMIEGDPIGPDNDRWLLECAKRATLIVAAWGVHGAFRGRGVAVRALLPRLRHLGLTQAGQPRHPVYVPAASRPMAWEGAA